MAQAVGQLTHKVTAATAPILHCMTWLQELPYTVRLIPVGLFLLCIVGVFVFLAKRPVDGEIVLAETASENRAGIAIALVLTAIAILPSMLALLLALAIAVGALFALRSKALLERLEYVRL